MKIRPDKQNNMVVVDEKYCFPDIMEKHTIHSMTNGGRHVHGYSLINRSLVWKGNGISIEKKNENKIEW